MISQHLTKKMENDFLHLTLKEIPKILTFIDTEEKSDTYGCCYYPYWRGGNDPLIREPNFVNARWQEIAFTLALLYSRGYPSNIYFQDHRILKMIKITLLYWSKIQNRDGSFSEWSVYEHGQPPTSFGLFSMIEAYKIIKNEFTRNETFKIKRTFRKAADWLCKNVDKRALNHEVVAVSALYSAYTLFKKDHYLKVISEKLKVIMKFQSMEGWLKEIDGPDTGYNLLSLTHLSIYWKMSADSRVLKIMKKILDFNKYFVYPDGVHGGGFNSRFASASWTLGCAILANEYEVAKSLCFISLKSITTGKIKGQHNYTDYQRCVTLYYYLLTYDEIKNIKNKVNLNNIPSFSNKIILKKFPLGEIFIVKNRNYYAVIGPGASIGELYSYKKRKSFFYSSPMNLLNVSGITLYDKNDGALCSMSRSSNLTTSFIFNKIVSEGTLYPVIMNRWGINEKTKADTTYKKSVKFSFHILSNYLPMANKIILASHKKIFKKQQIGRVKIRRSLEFGKRDITVKNTIFLNENAAKFSDIQIKETLFLNPEEEINQFRIFTGSMHNIKEFFTKKSITAFELYYDNKFLFKFDLDTPTKLNFLIEDDKMEGNRNNMKFTNGRGLILCMNLNENNKREKIILNYKISL